MIVKINNNKIGESHPVFIIAEIGINHNGDIKIAKKLIKMAKNAGADAVKFQTFKAEDLVSKSSKYHSLFKKLELNNDIFKELAKFSKKQGIIFLSTPFSEKAVDLLVECNCDAFKIASGDLTNIPLIKYAAKKQKPMIISTGMSTLEEIKEAVKSIKSQKNNQIIILHSISGYPTPLEEANLNSILFLSKKFSYPIGFSDNGNNKIVSQVATALGACMIEKHFTFDKKALGPDHKISSDVKELTEIIKNIKNIKKTLGNYEKSIQKCEKENRVHARRGIIANKDIQKNSIIKEDMISIKRPALGIPPKDFKKILNKIAKRKIKFDEPINWKDLK